MVFNAFTGSTTIQFYNIFCSAKKKPIPCSSLQLSVSVDLPAMDIMYVTNTVCDPVSLWTSCTRGVTQYGIPCLHGHRVHME